MLHDQLPIFDYGVTWEPELAGSSGALTELCNESAEKEVLVDVHVDAGAYAKAREPAVTALKALPDLDDGLKGEIGQELSVLEYRWRPRLQELGELDEEARTIASFRYGALLFHYYAEAISDPRQPLDQRAEHVLHARRARASSSPPHSRPVASCVSTRKRQWEHFGIWKSRQKGLSKPSM